MEQDGETAIRLMDAEGARGKELAPEEVFSGWLSVKGGLVVTTALLEEILELPVEDGQIWVRILTNHPSEPDEVDIVVSTFEGVIESGSEMV